MSQPPRRGGRKKKTPSRLSIGDGPSYDQKVDDVDEAHSVSSDSDPEQSLESDSEEFEDRHHEDDDDEEEV